MRITGAVSSLIGAVALVLVALGAVGAVGGSWSGYACLGACALLFGGAGVALLAGSRAMPADWPPPDTRSGNGDEGGP
jgi:hypothetical protein